MISVILLLPCSAGAGGISIVDDFGNRVPLPGPAKRIIALYGAFNEILGAMGLEERIVGKTKADSLPRSILAKPSIGTHMRPNVEIVLSLKPDLILQAAGRKEGAAIVDQLRKEGLCVAVFNPSTFETLFSAIRKLGLLTGEEAAAENLVQSLGQRLAAVETRLKTIATRPSVFLEVRHTNLLGAGRTSIVNEIIEKAGGRNCIDLPKKMVRIGMETLIEKDPDVYVVQQGPMNRNPTLPSERPHFRVLEAVKNKRFLMVEEQVYSRPGPRSVEAVESLAAFLHPELFQ
jgi:iron complex transport system substrate-binding protein